MRKRFSKVHRNKIQKVRLCLITQQQQKFQFVVKIRRLKMKKRMNHKSTNYYCRRACVLFLTWIEVEFELGLLSQDETTLYTLSSLSRRSASHLGRKKGRKQAVEYKEIIPHWLHHYHESISMQLQLKSVAIHSGSLA